MRTLTIALILVAAIALAACGGGDPLALDPGKDEPSTSTEAGESAREAGTTQGSARGETDTQTKPAKRRLIYLDARTLCGQFGVQQVVRRFGLEPGGAEGVARDFAERNYSGPFRAAAHRGCLSGFRK